MDIKNLSYSEGIMVLIAVMLIPLCLYMFYFEMLIRYMILKDQKKQLYKMIIPSASEQEELKNKGLIILYSYDANQNVLCEEGELNTEKVRYVYNREHEMFYRYEKVEL
ncbi:hypothetical protein [Paenibacillus sp. 2TAB26]|uniref:hypothetical protein n=1 Tax=Paenibacillus sp. 2TAB26 TaxID=3233005 RepID=UPI003F9A0537